jgi:hypothetical protein
MHRPNILTDQNVFILENPIESGYSFQCSCVLTHNLSLKVIENTLNVLITDHDEA